MATATAPLETRQIRRSNNAVWFEVPVRDLAKAIEFYEAAFAVRLQMHPSFPELAMFPRDENTAVTGAIVESGNGIPSSDGTVVYLNCDGDLDGILKRALANGATLLKEVAQLPGSMGFTAQFRDPDGNRIGLHASF